MINLKTIHARQNSPAKQKISVIHPDNFQQLIPTYFAFISPSKLSPKPNSALKLLFCVFIGYSLVLFVHSSTSALCVHKKHHKKPHFFFFQLFLSFNRNNNGLFKVNFSPFSPLQPFLLRLTIPSACSTPGEGSIASQERFR